MRKLYSLITTIIITSSVFAQAPEKMSYQAVVRDGSNLLVASSSVGMQISILQGSSSGTAVYVETQTPTSNANGLVSIEIGGGTLVSGNFTTIDWANGPYFVKTETDPTGGISYTITGTSQLLSVPYALHAKTAETVINNGIELTLGDLTNFTSNSVYYSSPFPNYTSTVSFSTQLDLKITGNGNSGFAIINNQDTTYFSSTNIGLENYHLNNYNVNIMNGYGTTTLNNGDNIDVVLYFMQSEYAYVRLTFSYTIQGL